MQSATTLNSSLSKESALKDTQIDEYYADLTSEGYEDSYKSLAENPYPGLRPFRTTESIVFFGREGISSDLVTRLAKFRFLAVLGSSGTGKSSLIRAGLLPVLETLPGRNGSWKIAICRPGKNPFGNLARALSLTHMATSYSEMEIWKILSSSSYGYQQLYNEVNTTITYNTLIVIDQFEELFRYRNDYGVSGRNDAALFVKMLIDTSLNEKLHTYVLITMRSEYLGDCVQLPQLVDAINKGQYLVPRLNSKQLFDVISEPVSFSGASLEEGYAAKLIGEIGDNMDQLPVLQHVLRRSYDAARNDAKDGAIKVTYNDYIRVGKMESALDKHATEVYNKLTDKQKEYCKIVFQSITDTTTDGRGIRRPLTFASLLNICIEKEQTRGNENQIRLDLTAVVNNFRKDNVNFLMPPPHVQLSDDLEIDISHESLMRIWKELQKWISEEARDAALLDELFQRDEMDYIKGARLSLYKEWLKRKRPRIGWATLYKNSDQNNDAFREKFYAAIDLIAKSKTKQLVARWTLIGLLSTILLIIIAALVIFQRQNDTLHIKNEQLTENSQKIKATNDELELKNSKLFEDSINIHVVLKKQQQDLEKKNKELSETGLALAKKNEDITAKSTKLTHTLAALEEAKEEAEKSVALEQESNKLLTKARDSLKGAYASANQLKNYALAIKHSEKSLAIPAYDLKRENIKADLALQSYQLFLESGEDNKRLQPQVYNALYFALRNKFASDSSDKDVWRVTPYIAGVDHLASAAIANSMDNHIISYLTAEDKKIYSFDFESGKTTIISDLGVNNKLVNVTSSASGKWIVINTLSKKLLLIDNTNLNQQETISLSGIVRTAKFSMDDATLYAFTQDSVLTAINLTSKAKSSTKIKFKLEDIAVSSNYIYGLTLTGDIVSWPRNNHDLTLGAVSKLTDLKEKGRGTTINCTSNDSLIVWGNERGQVFYKRLRTMKDQYLTRFGGPVTNIAFDESANLLAISSYDKTVQVFNLPKLQSGAPLTLNNNEGPVTSVFFQKEKNGNKNLVAVISPGIIRKYPMKMESLACKLNKFYKDKRPAADEINRYLDPEIVNKEINIKCP